MPTRQRIFFSAALLVGFVVGGSAAKEPVDYVNPMIGTLDSRDCGFLVMNLEVGSIHSSSLNRSPAT